MKIITGLCVLLLLVVIFLAWLKREGMECSHYVTAMKAAVEKGKMANPFCADGFPLDPSSQCDDFNGGCEPKYHAVCPGTTREKNGMCV